MLMRSGRSRVVVTGWVCGVLAAATGFARAVSDIDDPPLPPPLEARESAIETAFEEFPDLKPDAVFDFMRENFPDWMQEFNETVLRNTRRGVEELEQIIEEYLELRDLARENPVLYARILEHRKLENRSRRLARGLAQESGAGRDAVMAELRDVLDRSFQIKQELMRMDVQEMAEDLEELRSLIDKRQDNKDALIQRRLKELTGDDEELTW